MTAPALRFLRRQTLTRAVAGYVRWFQRAVGWWTAAYLLFWLGVFIVAGVQSAAPLTEPLTISPVLITALGVGALLVVLLPRAAPPVWLDRRDLFRLGVAPLRPWRALTWRYRLKQATFALAGALIGSAWWVTAYVLTGVGAPVAPLTSALYGLLLLDVSWLVYARHAQHGAWEGRTWTARSLKYLSAVTVAALALPGLMAAALGGEAGRLLNSLDPLAGILGGSLLSAALLIGLLAWSRALVKGSLAGEWPSRFPPHCLLLSQVQAMRTLELVAALSGGGSGSSQGERKRLLAVLRDERSAVRPERSLPLPGAGRPQWLALAWRAALASLRSPLHQLALTLLLGLASAVAALYLAPSQGALVAGLLVVATAARLLGPPLGQGALPVSPGARALGRTLPALSVLGVLLLTGYALTTQLTTLLSPLVAGAVLTAVPLVLPGMLVSAVLLALTGVLALEKYSTWSGATPGRLESQLVSALLAALPGMLLPALGVAAWVIPAQLALLALVLLVSV